MNLKSKLVVVCAMTMSLVGCGSDSATGPSVEVMAASGQTVSLNGAYKTLCYFDNDVSRYKQDSHSFSGNTLTVKGTSYPSDATCVTSETVDYTFVFTVVTASDIQITGWVDGMGGGATGPNLQSSDVDTLTDTETVTPLTVTVTSSSEPGMLAVGDVSAIFYVVDDSDVDVSGVYLYRDNDYSAGDTFVGISDPLIQ